jgi:hypothetical protein
MIIKTQVNTRSQKFTAYLVIQDQSHELDFVIQGEVLAPVPTTEILIQEVTRLLELEHEITEFTICHIKPFKINEKIKSTQVHVELEFVRWWANNNVNFSDLPQLSDTNRELRPILVQTMADRAIKQHKKNYPHVY